MKACIVGVIVLKINLLLKLVALTERHDKLKKNRFGSSCRRTNADIPSEVDRNVKRGGTSAGMKKFPNRTPKNSFSHRI